MPALVLVFFSFEIGIQILLKNRGKGTSCQASGLQAYQKLAGSHMKVLVKLSHIPLERYAEIIGRNTQMLTRTGRAT